MAWYDYLGAAGDTLSDVGTSVHGMQRQRRSDEREDVLDKRALLEQHRAELQETQRIEDRERGFLEQEFSERQIGDTFDINDPRTQQFIARFGRDRFRKIPGQPGFLQVRQSLEEQAATLDAQNTVDTATIQNNARKFLNSPDAINAPLADKKRWAADLGIDVEPYLTPEQRITEAELEPQIRAAHITAETMRQGTAQRIANTAALAELTADFRQKTLAGAQDKAQAEAWNTISDRYLALMELKTTPQQANPDVQRESWERARVMSGGGGPSWDDVLRANSDIALAPGTGLDSPIR